MKRDRKVVDTLWWPAHRPLQYTQVASVEPGQPGNYQWLNWSSGVQQTNAGDLKMVTEWEVPPVHHPQSLRLPAQTRTTRCRLSGPAPYVTCHRAVQR